MAGKTTKKKTTSARSIDATGDGPTKDFFAKTAKKTGGEVLANIDSVSYFVDTGNLAVNYICSGYFITGGVPGGKLTEIFGPSSSSKSLFGNNILFGCQKINGVAVLIDAENSANKEFIKKASHADLDQILRYTPPTLEQVFAKIYEVIEFIRGELGPNVPIVIVYDSITVSPCERELREVKLPANYTQAQFKAIVGAKQQPGERARICSTEFRKLNTMMEKYNVTVIVLNQTRSKIGVLYGNPETTGGGGNALEFYASCRLRPQTQKKIEQKLSAKKKKILGINVKMVNKKNKTHRPFVESDGIQLTFDKGINPLGGLLSCLLDAGRIENKGSGNFSVKEPWAAGQQVAFKGSLDTNNTVPVDVLLQCPLLIDAQTSDEVKAYLDPFKSAMEFEIAGDVEETDVTDGDSEEEGIDEQIDAELELGESE
jgi:recombination protein RecA